MPTIDTDDYPVQPSDIELQAGREIWDTFGKTQVESEAALIIQFCQSRDSWRPFTANEFASWLLETYGANRGPLMQWLESRGHELVIHREDDTYAITSYLVDHVRAKYPAPA